jgi:hypothetical protein
VARDYDAQLLESVAVRRRRLRDAVLFGRQRTRRTFNEGINRIVAGLCVAAVVCAGCVGWSFVRTQLLKQKVQQSSPAASPTSTSQGTAEVPVPASWVGAQVTLPMLRSALDQAGVPHTLYALPGQRRPPAGPGYYLLAKTPQGFSAGTVEGSEGRTGPEFGTEDEACRWMYDELVLRESPPVHLTPAQEQQAATRTAALVSDVQAKTARNGGAPLGYLLPAGLVVDAFGQESGATLSPDGTPFARRGLPKAVRATVDPKTPKNYHRYRVLQPFEVDASIVPEGRGGTGGGVRLTVSAGLFNEPPALPTIRWLLRNGYLGRVAVAAVPR